MDFPVAQHCALPLLAPVPSFFDAAGDHDAFRQASAHQPRIAKYPRSCAGSKKQPAARADSSKMKTGKNNCTALVTPLYTAAAITIWITQTLYPRALPQDDQADASQSGTSQTRQPVWTPGAPFGRNSAQ